MPKETTLTGAILRLCKSLGCHATKTHMTVYGTTGDPDIRVLVPVPGQRYAVPLFIEVKVPGKPLTPLQKKRASDLRRFGAIVLEAPTLDEVRETIQKLRGN